MAPGTPLVLGSVNGGGVDLHKAATTMGVAPEQQKGLNKVTDDEVVGNVPGGITEADEGGEQIGFLDVVVDDLTTLNRSSRNSEASNTDTSYGEISLAT